MWAQAAFVGLILFRIILFDIIWQHGADWSIGQLNLLGAAGALTVLVGLVAGVVAAVRRDWAVLVWSAIILGLLALGIEVAELVG